jgi:hypothetical protein
MFDLFCGLGGATEAFLAEGWDCIGIDIEAHVYGEHRYPAQLWIQDILTIDGAQLRHAEFLWASPPCQAYSYMAMPWSLAKARAAAIRADATGQKLAELNALFDACFRLQREASAAAGRRIPMVVENVKGAIPWVGRSRWNFGSFHLWGDVPALMPIAWLRLKGGQTNWRDHDKPEYRGEQLQDHFAREGVKNPGLDWSAHREPDYRTSGKGACFRDSAGSKVPGFRFDGVSKRSFQSASVARVNDGKARKAASAMIAKIPQPLAQHIARVFLPREQLPEAAE